MIAFYNNKYANFSGRATRGEYRYFILILVVLVVFIGLMYVLNHSNLSLIFNLCVFQLVLFVPLQAVTIRRLKDLGMNWHYSLLFFLPFLNLLLMMYLLLTPGQRGVNHYGEDPKLSSEMV